MGARFDLLLLDMDGTLVDSQAILVALVNDTLRALGWPDADERLIAAQIGLPLEEVFRAAAAAANPAAITALCARYRQCADAPDFVRRFRLYSGVRSTLARLRKAQAKLVVATSKGRATAMDIVRHCGIDDLIDGVLGGDCVVRGKPHPEMVHLARRQFPAEASRTLMVGDTSFDVQMGHAAGVATCAVTYGMHTAESLRALQPRFVIDRFEVLADISIDG